MPPGGLPPIVDEGDPADSVIVVEDDDDSPEGLALAAAEQAWVSGDYLTAAALSDSLNRAWTRRPGLGDGPVRRLARLLFVRAEDVAAIDQLLRHPSTLDDAWFDALRAAAGRLSIDELDYLSGRISSDDRALGVVQAEYAWALARTGADSLARSVAADLEEADLYDEDRRKVEDVLAGRVAPAMPRIRIGFVAPRSGPLQPVGDQLIEGARLAAERYQSETNVPVELVIIDEATLSDSAGIEAGDGSDRIGGVPGDTMDIGRDSVGVGVDDDGFGSPGDAEGFLGGIDPSTLAAVVGPVRSEALRAAASRRAIPGLAVLSPTASEDSALAPHAYSLWDRARRDSLAASELARWTVSAFEPMRIAALHPDDESGARRTRIFRSIVEPAGFEWVGAEAYDPAMTTYEEEIRALTEADPDVVYVVADGPRQVLQVAPQLHFYGLRGRIILATQDWTHPIVLRRLDEPFSDYRVASVYFERAGNPAWEGFAAAWDEEYRRALPDDAFAALGYDAVSLILGLVQDPALVRPAAVARALTDINRFTGVTGRFSFDPESRRLTRAMDIRMILHGELTEPDVQAIVDWSIETREQEERRLEREAEEERQRGSF